MIKTSPIFRRVFLACAITLSLAVASLPVAQVQASEGIPVPVGPVILTVTGEITNTNAPEAAIFDLEELERIGTVDLVTDTPWTETEVRFTGVLIRDLLDLLGASGTTVSMVALNDYAVTIPIEDFSDHDVIIATQRDGAVMRVRDKGPLWVIYPWSEKPELRNEVYYSRSIWQLKSIEVLE